MQNGPLIPVLQCKSKVWHTQ